jgi:hypothetical protein
MRALCVVLLLSSVAAAEHTEVSVEHASDEHASAAEHHKPHHRFHIGFIGTFLGTFVEGEQFATAGGGVFFTWIAVPSRFELELSVRGFHSEGGAALSQDLVAVFPFHVSHVFHPFIGFGPTVGEYFLPAETFGGERRRGWGAGGTVAVGAHLWSSPRHAVLVNFDYNILYRELDGGEGPRSALVHEAGITVGVFFGL